MPGSGRRRWLLTACVNATRFVIIIIAIALVLPYLHLYSDLQPKGPPIRLLLVGMAGTGKSSSGNTILQNETFKSDWSTTTVTQQCQEGNNTVLGRHVKVVDLPGLADAELSEKDALVRVINETKRAVELCPDGYDAILVTIRLGRLNKGDKVTVDQLKGIFGERYFNEYGILLVTHGDDFDSKEKTFEEWSRNQEGLYKELLKECRGRALLIDNKSKSKGVKDDQLNKLFRMVDDMRAIAGRYTPDIFRAAQKQRDRLILEAEEPRIRATVEEEAEMFVKELHGIDIEDIKEHSKLDTIKLNISARLGELKELDKNTGALNSVIKILRGVELAVTEKINLANRIALKLEMERKYAEDIRKLQENFKKTNDQTKEEIAQYEETIRKIQAELTKLQVQTDSEREDWKRKEQMERNYAEDIRKLQEIVKKTSDKNKEEIAQYQQTIREVQAEWTKIQVQIDRERENWRRQEQNLVNALQERRTKRDTLVEIFVDFGSRLWKKILPF